VKLAPRTLVAATVAIALLIGASFLGVRRNQQAQVHALDLANLKAIAGLSGAGPQVYFITPSEELKAVLEKSKRDPKQAVPALTKALEDQVAIEIQLGQQVVDRTSPQGAAIFDAGLAYSYRLVLLGRWRPGMKREEILKIYNTWAPTVRTKYDFKNHTRDFFGFE